MWRKNIILIGEKRMLLRLIFSFRNTGVLYLFPPSSFSDASESYVSITQNLLSFSSVSYVTFQNMNVNFARQIAIKGTNLNHVVISNCDLSNTGDTSVVFDGYNSGVTDCIIQGNYSPPIIFLMYFRRQW